MDLTLLPANEPIVTSASIFWAHLVSNRGNRALLMITKRFSKLSKTVPLRITSTDNTAKTFKNIGIFCMVPPKKHPSNDGKQFTVHLFTDFCLIICTSNLFTNTYHPQTKIKTELFNCNLLATPCRYVMNHPYNRDEFTDVLIYTYNTQRHSGTGVAPLQLVLARPHPHSLWMLAQQSWLDEHP